MLTPRWNRLPTLCPFKTSLIPPRWRMNGEPPGLRRRLQGKFRIKKGDFECGGQVRISEPRFPSERSRTCKYPDLELI